MIKPYRVLPNTNMALVSFACGHVGLVRVDPASNTPVWQGRCPACVEMARLRQQFMAARPTVFLR